LPPDVDLSAHMAAYSLPLPPRCLDSDNTVMAMRRQPCELINRHLEATPD